MANKIQWDAEDSTTSYLTTELNSLANGSGKLGAEITTSQDMFLSVELSIATQGSARDSGAYVSLYVVPSIDGGSTYAYGSDSLVPSTNHYKGNFLFDAATNARVDIVENIFIGAGRYKIYVANETGQAFASTSNTVKYSLHTPELQ